MKHLLTLCLASVGLMLFACQTQPETSTKAITVKVKGKTGKKPKKLRIYDYAFNPLDSILLTENGTYEIDGNWERPQILYVKDDDYKERHFKTILSEKNVLLKIDFPADDIITNKHLAVSYVETPLLGQYQAYQTVADRIAQDGDSLKNVWNALRKKYAQIPQEKREAFDNSYEEYYAKKNQHTQDYVNTHNNLITQFLYLTSLRFSYGFEDLVKILENTPEEIKNSVYGKALSAKKQLLEKIRPGAVAPDIEKPDTAGNMLALSSLRGKYVLLDFWASWCGPCRKENPSIKQAYAKYKEKGFEVYAVSLDYPNDKDKWVAAIEADSLPWHHVSSLLGWRDSVAKIYNISGIPAPFLLDTAGRILAKETALRGENLSETLKQYLGEK